MGPTVIKAAVILTSKVVLYIIKDHGGIVADTFRGLRDTIYVWLLNSNDNTSAISTPHKYFHLCAKVFRIYNKTDSFIKK